MRKTIIAPTLPTTETEQKWLDLANCASIEISSEDEDFPIESALSGQDNKGWRAATPGIQTIRLIFDQPQRIKQISLTFEEAAVNRTQEFRLQWSPDRGGSFREIVRQQWNFSSPHAIREMENYGVDLANVTVLELTIEPDKDNSKARASLLRLRLR